ncbi:hypothetical protein [Phyllobacterium sp. SB3]|uniref:hypothetical protein n=1 Tax=Phyllobacterium sp. SB3 TaxID=3156073 RepID=UPI0032AEE70A
MRTTTFSYCSLWCCNYDDAALVHFKSGFAHLHAKRISSLDLKNFTRLNRNIFSSEVIQALANIFLLIVTHNHQLVCPNVSRFEDANLLG